MTKLSAGTCASPTNFAKSLFAVRIAAEKTFAAICCVLCAKGLWIAMNAKRGHFNGF
jgi:hypothetical protein